MASREIGFWKFLAIMTATAIGYITLFVIVTHVLRIFIYV